MTTAIQRLQRELRSTKTTLPPGISLHPTDDVSMFHWMAVLTGPPDTPYADGRFSLEIQVPSSYPMTPPSIKFRTPICHPNVHWRTGEVCVDILKTAWSPAWGLVSALQAIQALLSDPEPDSPLNCDAGNLLRAGDKRGYEALAKMYTIELARPKSD